MGDPPQSVPPFDGTQRQRDSAENQRSAESDKPPYSALDILLLLARAKWLILVCSISAALLGACIAFSAPLIYMATATIIPPQPPLSAASSFIPQQQQNPLSALNRSASPSSNLMKDPGVYAGILQSTTISDKIIEQFHLQSQWHTKVIEDARKRLRKNVQFEISGKTGLIDIRVADPNPAQASAMANAYVDQLNQIDSQLASGLAEQRRVLYQQQLAQEKTALAKAENDMKAVQQKTGILSPTGQAQLTITGVAQARAQISEMQVQLQALKISETNQNPQVVRLRNEIAAAQAHLHTLQDDEQKLQPGDTQIAANEVPIGSLEYARALREVLYHSTLFDLLSRQYEAARLDEGQAAPVIQVIDHAVAPDHKSAPPRLLVVLVSGFLGFCAACGCVFLSAAFQKAHQSAEDAPKIEWLFRRLHWRHE